MVKLSVLAIISGMSLGIGLPPEAGFLLGIVSIVVISGIIDSELITRKHRMLAVGVFFLSYFYTSAFWISKTAVAILDEGVASFFYGQGLLLIITFAASILMSIPFFLYMMLPKFRYGILQSVAFALSWTIGEIIRTEIPYGMPISYLGYVAIDNIYFLQLAKIVTVFGVGFFVCLIAHLLLQFRKNYIVIFIVVSILYGYGIFNIHLKTVNYDLVSGRLVNANIPQKMLGRFGDPKFVLENHLKQTEFASNLDVDIFFWPESMLRYHDGDETQWARISSLLSDNQTLIAGGYFIQRSDNDDVRVYTSLFSLDNKSYRPSRYDKKRLLFLGEHIPYRNKLPSHLKAHLGSRNFEYGQLSSSMELKSGLKIFPMLCSEAHFPQLLFNNLTDQDFIVILANEAWVSGTRANHESIAAAKFRAIESGRAVVLVSNGGFLAVVDRNGTIISSTTSILASSLNVAIPIYDRS